MKFNHIGIAVRDIDSSIEAFSVFGYSHDGFFHHDTIQNVRIAFLTGHGQPMLELVQPINESSPVVNFLSRNGTSMYHKCFEVTDIMQSIESLKQQKYRLISSPKPAIAFKHRLVCFMFHKDAGLIELLSVS